MCAYSSPRSPPRLHYFHPKEDGPGVASALVATSSWSGIHHATSTSAAPLLKLAVYTHVSNMPQVCPVTSSLVCYTTTRVRPRKLQAHQHLEAFSILPVVGRNEPLARDVELGIVNQALHIGVHLVIPSWRCLLDGYRYRLHEDAIHEHSDLARMRMMDGSKRGGGGVMILPGSP